MLFLLFLYYQFIRHIQQQLEPTKRKVKCWMLSELDKSLLCYNTMDTGNDTDNDKKINSLYIVSNS